MSKQKRAQCEACKLWFMSEELETTKAKIRITKKRIITANLSLCLTCKQKDILTNI